MSELKVNNLNVDLLQDQATVALFSQGVPQSPGKLGFTAVNVQVPIKAPGDLPESNLRKLAIEAAKKTLEEAIKVLKAYPI